MHSYQIDGARNMIDEIEMMVLDQILAILLILATHTQIVSAMAIDIDRLAGCWLLFK